MNKIKVGYKSTSGQAVGMSMALTENSTYLFKHEYEHTKQALWFGPFWPFVYFGAIVAAKKTTWRQAYLDSYFEVKAREAGHAS